MAGGYSARRGPSRNLSDRRHLHQFQLLSGTFSCRQYCSLEHQAEGVQLSDAGSTLPQGIALASRYGETKVVGAPSAASASWRSAAVSSPRATRPRAADAGGRACLRAAWRRKKRSIHRRGFAGTAAQSPAAVNTVSETQTNSQAKRALAGPGSERRGAATALAAGWLHHPERAQEAPKKPSTASTALTEEQGAGQATASTGRRQRRRPPLGCHLCHSVGACFRVRTTYRALTQRAGLVVCKAGQGSILHRFQSG